MEQNKGKKLSNLLIVVACLIVILVCAITIKFCSDTLDVLEGKYVFSRLNNLGRINFSVDINNLESNVAQAETSGELEQVEHPHRVVEGTYEDIPAEVISDPRFDYVLNSEYFKNGYNYVDVVNQEGEFIQVFIYYEDYYIGVYKGIADSKMIGLIRDLEGNLIADNIIPEDAQ